MNEVSNQPGQWPKGENLRVDSLMLQGLRTFGPAPLVVTRTARPLFSRFFFFSFLRIADRGHHHVTDDVVVAMPMNSY